MNFFFRKQKKLSSAESDPVPVKSVPSPVPVPPEQVVAPAEPKALLAESKVEKIPNSVRRNEIHISGRKVTQAALRATPVNVPLIFPTSAPSEGSLFLNVSSKFQVMEGFGGSLVYYKNFVSEHPNKNMIYEKMFDELRISVLRIRNHFNQRDDFIDEEQHLQIDSEFVREALTRLPDEKPHIMMCSWTPPAILKQNESVKGGGLDSVLKKDEFGEFRYKDFAQYWLDALIAYKEVDVDPTYISIQNEPDYTTPSFETCRFDAAESYFVPGYYKAFDVTYDVLHKNLDRVPQMIGPETAGFDSFQDHPYAGHPRIAAQSGHIYNAGERFTGADFFPRLDGILRNGLEEAQENQTKRVFMTEYANLQDHQQGDPLLLAQSVYDVLTKANASMYLNWDLMWGANSGEGTLLLVENPFVDQSTWNFPNGFATTQSFEWFKHFSRYVRRGMERIDTTLTSSLKDVLSLAFVNRSGSTTVICINKNEHPCMVNVGRLPASFPDKPYRVFYSTLSERFTEEPEFSITDKLQLRPKSITTLYSGPIA